MQNLGKSLSPRHGHHRHVAVDGYGMAVGGRGRYCPQPRGRGAWLWWLSADSHHSHVAVGTAPNRFYAPQKLREGKRGSRFPFDPEGKGDNQDLFEPDMRVIIAFIDVP